MSPVLVLAALCVAAASSVAANDDSFPATGTMYITYNNGVGKDTDRALSVRFVPKGAVIPGPPGSPDSSQAVRHFNIDNPRASVEAILGQREMYRLYKDPMRVVSVPATVVLQHHRRIVECDAPADYATLLSTKALQRARPVSRDAAPIGC